MSYFRSPSFDLGAIGRDADIFNCLKFIPYVTHIILLLILTTVHDPSHLPEGSLNILMRSPGTIYYIKSGGCFDSNAPLIIELVTVVSNSALTNLRASSPSVCFVIVLGVTGKVVKTP